MKNREKLLLDIKISIVPVMLGQAKFHLAKAMFKNDHKDRKNIKVCEWFFFLSKTGQIVSNSLKKCNHPTHSPNSHPIIFHQPPSSPSPADEYSGWTKMIHERPQVGFCTRTIHITKSCGVVEKLTVFTQLISSSKKHKMKSPTNFPTWEVT